MRVWHPVRHLVWALASYQNHCRFWYELHWSSNKVSHWPLGQTVEQTVPSCSDGTGHTDGSGLGSATASALGAAAASALDAPDVHEMEACLKFTGKYNVNITKMSKTPKRQARHLFMSNSFCKQLYPWPKPAPPDFWIWDPSTTAGAGCGVTPGGGKRCVLTNLTTISHNLFSHNHGGGKMAAFERELLLRDPYFTSMGGSLHPYRLIIGHGIKSAARQDFTIHDWQKNIKNPPKLKHAKAIWGRANNISNIQIYNPKS